jgi:hypothetical protein
MITEWEDLAATFLGLPPEGRVALINTLADKGFNDDFLQALFVAHRKLENQNNEP